MFNTTHNIAEEFPHLKEQIHRLKMTSEHFARVYAEYDEVDKQVLRIEQEIDKVSDMLAEKFKRQRLALKDEIFAMLKQAA